MDQPDQLTNGTAMLLHLREQLAQVGRAVVSRLWPTCALVKSQTTRMAALQIEAAQGGTADAAGRQALAQLESALQQLQAAQGRRQQEEDCAARDGAVPDEVMTAGRGSAQLAGEMARCARPHGRSRAGQHAEQLSAPWRQGHGDHGFMQLQSLPQAGGARGCAGGTRAGAGRRCAAAARGKHSTLGGASTSAGPGGSSCPWPAQHWQWLWEI